MNMAFAGSFFNMVDNTSLWGMTSSRPRAGSSSSGEYGPPPPPKSDGRKLPFGRTTEQDRHNAEDLGYVLSGARRARIQAERAKRAEPSAAEKRVQMLEEIKKRQERETKIIEDLKKMMEEQQQAKKQRTE